MDPAEIMETAEESEKRVLLEGGKPALASLFLQYRDRLERIVCFRIDSRIRGRLDPADVLQEAYIEIAKRIDEFVTRSDVSFFVWARQRTVQTLIDMQRRQFRERRDINREVRFSADPDDQGTGTSLSIARFLIDQITSPSLAAVRAEETTWLQEALNSMNEIDREVLALRHFEQLTNQQVSEVLGLSPTAASNRYLRAAARLGEMLSRLNSQSTHDGR